jgi:hypothetical protein
MLPEDQNANYCNRRYANCQQTKNGIEYNQLYIIGEIHYNQLISLVSRILNGDAWCFRILNIHKLPLRDREHLQSMHLSQWQVGSWAVNAWYFRIHSHIHTLPLRCNFHNRYISVACFANLGWWYPILTSAYCRLYDTGEIYLLLVISASHWWIEFYVCGDTWYSHILTFISCRWETALMISASHW